MRLRHAIIFLALGLTLAGIAGCDFLQGSHLRDNGDGTVTDKETGLTWFRCVVGQRWTGSACEGKPILMDRKEARRAADGFTYANRENWRIPSAQELHLIVYCSNDTKSPYVAGQDS